MFDQENGTTGDIANRTRHEGLALAKRILGGRLLRGKILAAQEVRENMRILLERYDAAGAAPVRGDGTVPAADPNDI